MIPSQDESLIADYLGSEHFLFLDPALKESADGILRAFFERARIRGASDLETLDAKTVETVLLQDLGKLALPPAAKSALPDLLEGFFGYLQDSGRWPGAGIWRHSVVTAAERYRGALRPDGSMRGETFKKAYTDVGRNDPCPCGSGKKFKKCCGPLIGL